MNVGQSLPHESAAGLATGKALFIDDIPPIPGELFVGVVGSPVANGLLLGMELSEARCADGVVGVFTRADIPGNHHFGAVVADEPFLADERVHYIGQPVAAVAARTRQEAARACALVKVQVEEQPACCSIDDAIRSESFLGGPRRITRGDFDAAWALAPGKLEGVIDIGGQEHFYFESQAAIAYPGENGSLRVHASTQNPTELQTVIAAALNLGMHAVVCECRRMGGAFGGKETQAAIPAFLAALVAHKTNRAARVVYTKREDLLRTGKRHPFRCFWKVGFDENGQILCARLEFYSDGGCSTDLSLAVLERTILHADNAYFIPDIDIRGRVCRTNLPSNTAFRGFGAPQAVAVMENILQEVAISLRKDAYEVRRRNCYGSGKRRVTPYGQIVEGNSLPRIFRQLAKTADYKARLAAIVKFNETSKSSLRGIAMTAVKFGISFTKKFLNQANAMVNVYTDGTVQVSTGATEMGQGVHTKIRQLVADEFGIGVDTVSVMITSTEKSNNTSPTSASVGTDLNGAAAVDACRQIRERLARVAAMMLAEGGEKGGNAAMHMRFAGARVYDERGPQRTVAFRDLVHQARLERVDLGARGFYATPGLDFHAVSGQGRPFLYYTMGAAVAEVVVDRFTGELDVERIDILMDLGRMINPGIDRGQVIGAFMQGLGWLTTEELRFDGERLTSDSISNYKIPAITDLPKDFRLDFLKSNNRKNLGGSRAVGEPPLLLALAMWAAVKHALSFVHAGHIQPLGIPATPERIMLCLRELENRREPRQSRTHGSPA